ncbi:hydroxyacylglutathione hydrolase [Shewanella sp. UCD-KL21]|uniref:hydroxyacylglutathione hydrolase n=1 Tax=Shewanella sp. UCD-KL21 TaxID=1917164 RepID=UPI0009704478|nr:hydroxyacylglutathione hydrolase [Shewanella sp. UCD-KL21]
MLSVIGISAFNDNYIWLIHQKNSNQAYVVDPGCGQSVLDYLKGSPLELAGILITHHHADHTGGIAQLQQAFNNKLEVYGPETEHIAGITYPIKGEALLTLNGLDNALSVISVPGHTSGHIAYFYQPLTNTNSDSNASDANSSGALFCGDTLFSGGCGRLFEGTAEQMANSLAKLADLPPNTQVYCAHEYTAANLKFALQAEPNNKALQQYSQSVTLSRNNNMATIPTTIATELAINPFLRTNSKEIKQVIAAKFQVEKPTALQTFTLLREWKNNF